MHQIAGSGLSKGRRPNTMEPLGQQIAETRSITGFRIRCPPLAPPLTANQRQQVLYE